MKKKTIEESKLPKSTRFHMERYDALVGKKLTGMCVDNSDPGIEPVVGLKFGKTIAWILCDEEGNGPGCLDLQVLE